MEPIPSDSEHPCDQTTNSKVDTEESPTTRYIPRIPHDRTKSNLICQSRYLSYNINYNNNAATADSSPAPEHLVLEYVRVTIHRLWPYAHINVHTSRISTHHPVATRNWSISGEDPVETFGPSMGEEWAVKMNNRRGWHRFKTPIATRDWFIPRNLRKSKETGSNNDGNCLYIRGSKASWVPDMAERKWLLSLLRNQMLFNLPQEWMEHVGFEESLPANHKEWQAGGGAPWIMVECPQSTVCISIGDLEISKQAVRIP